MVCLERKKEEEEEEEVGQEPEREEEKMERVEEEERRFRRNRKNKKRMRSKRRRRGRWRRKRERRRHNLESGSVLTDSLTTGDPMLLLYHVVTLLEQLQSPHHLVPCAPTVQANASSSCFHSSIQFAFFQVARSPYTFIIFPQG